MRATASAPERHPEAVLAFRSVTKRFGGKGSGRRAGFDLTAVEGLSFAVPEGEFLSIVGPSGCGKSTILNLIAGLDRPSEGEVRVSGEPVTGPSTHVGFMLQKDLLLPWRTIQRNVEFGLEARPVAAAERRARARRELERCRLIDFADHYPYQLSGGMRQRAALARTLAIEPDVVLLDEPFSALDAQTKLILQKSFAGTIATSGLTAVLITHDLTEAVTMSDRVIVLSERPGRIVEEITLDLPHREDPIARRGLSRANDYIMHLFGLLKLEERLA